MTTLRIMIHSIMTVSPTILSIMTVSATIPSIMTVSIKTISITLLSIMTISTMVFCITTLMLRLVFYFNAKHNDTQHHDIMLYVSFSKFLC
jgi:hypothetical protein